MEIHTNKAMNCLVGYVMKIVFVCVLHLMIFVQESFCVVFAQAPDSLFLDDDVESCRLYKENFVYIKNKYEHELFDQKCLFYPAANSKRLIIIFAGALGDHYSMWSWFWKNTEDWNETAYLFLKDENTSWYLGNNKKSLVEDYINIIRHFKSKIGISADQIITVGISMGGYAAIFYAVECRLKGAIVFNPQVDKESAHGNFLVERAEDRWIDLDQMVASAIDIPYISLNFGSFPKDSSAAYKLLDVLKQKNCLTVFRRGLGKGHKDLAFDKKLLETEIWYLENAQQIREDAPTMNYPVK